MGCDVIPALIAGASALLGAVVGGFGTYLIAERQINAQTRAQLRERLVDPCRNYFHEVSKAVAIAELRREPGYVVPQAALEEQKRALAALTEAHAWLAIIAPEPVRAAVSQLQRSLPDRLLTEGLLPSNDAAAEQISTDVRDRLDGFLNAVREEFGIPN